MVSRITVVLLSLASSVLAAIDFTPTAFTVEYEGIRVQQPGFRNGTAIVTFAPPAGWLVEGSGSTLSLTPKDGSSSFARVLAKPLSGAAVTSEECLKSCREELVAALPRQAEGFQWDEVQSNPVLLNRHETVRLEAAYTVLGQSFRATLLVCNLADQQWRFIFTARERDFAKLSGEWNQSFYTWQGLK